MKMLFPNVISCINGSGLLRHIHQILYRIGLISHLRIGSRLLLSRYLHSFCHLPIDRLFHQTTDSKQKRFVFIYLSK